MRFCDPTSNRINTFGWHYDAAGNLMRGQNQSGTWLNFEYDAAGRLVKVKDDSTPNNVLETYTYGADRSRLICETPSQRTYYAWGGSSVIQEYTEPIASSIPVYSKSYVYAGSRLLSTATVVSGSEVTEFHHSDRLGTKLVTNPAANTNFEQSTLPFGTELAAEEVGTGSTNQKFTSYDRSAGTGLDYAMNRTHSPGQGRFMQVDPLGTRSSRRIDPKSLNLYSYVQNDPIGFIDPKGLLLQEIRYTVCVAIGYYIDGSRAGQTAYECHDEVAFIFTPDSPIDPPSVGGGGGIVSPASDKNDDNKLNNCMINAMGDWATKNSRAKEDYNTGLERTGGLTAFVLLPGWEPVALGSGALSAYFAYDDYQKALRRNSEDLKKDTLKCLADNPNASKSAKNLAINEANSNMGGIRIPYIN